MSIQHASSYNINLQENCPICLESFEEDGGSLVRALCGHLFHENCFVQWRMIPKDGDYARQEKSCPVCRGPLGDAQYIKPDTESQAAHVHGTVVPYLAVPGAVPSVPGEENPLAPAPFVDALAEEDAHLIAMNTQPRMDEPEEVPERVVRVERDSSAISNNMIGIGAGILILFVSLFIRVSR